MQLKIRSILVMLIGVVCFEAARCLLLRYYAFYNVCLSAIFLSHCTLKSLIFFLFKLALLILLCHIQALLFHKLGRSWRKTVDKVR